jgi:hypothetical protein
MIPPTSVNAVMFAAALLLLFKIVRVTTVNRGKRPMTSALLVSRAKRVARAAA